MTGGRKEQLFKQVGARQAKGIFERLGYRQMLDNLAGVLRRPRSLPDLRSKDDQRPIGDFYSALLAMASHDLRQPIQTIVAMHTLLARRLTGPSERLFLERAEQGTAQLVEQLNQLADALHVQERKGRVVAGPVAIEPLFGRLHIEHSEIARRRGLRLRSLPLTCEAISDRVMLEGILRNLLKNALTYTQPGGRILLACRRSGALLKLEVHDTGIGIPAGELEHVFDAFHRGAASFSGGFGLGLFIVKRAANSLGHRIEVCTRPGRGSCFRIIVDAANAEAPAVAGAGARRPEAPARTIPSEWARSR